MLEHPVCLAISIYFYQVDLASEYVFLLCYCW